MMLFLGSIIGCPLAGWLSDKIARRRPLMVIGAMMCLLIVFGIVYLPYGSYAILCALFLMLGIVSSAQVIGYPLVAESSPRVVTAMSVSIVNITTIAGIGMIQALFGYLMDLHIYHRLHHMSTDFISSDFNAAIWVVSRGLPGLL